MADEQHHLTVTLDGGPATEHRLPVTDMLRVSGQLQKAVRNVAAVLSHLPSGQGGRKRKAVEVATVLELVAQPRQSSFALDLELAPLPDSLSAEEEAFAPLGETALEAFVDGLGALDEQMETLPPGFDRGVLRDIVKISPVFRHGYTHVEFALNGAALPRTARLNAEVIKAAKRLIEEPVKAPAAVEGVLQMLDLAAHPLLCRVDRTGLPDVDCLIPNEYEEQVQASMGRLVRVHGLGEFEPGSDEPKRITVERLVLLPELTGVDRLSFRQHSSWLEVAHLRKVRPLQRAEDLAADVFESDDEFDDLLAFLHGE